MNLNTNSDFHMQPIFYHIYWVASHLNIIKNASFEEIISAIKFEFTFISQSYNNLLLIQFFLIN